MAIQFVFSCEHYSNKIPNEYKYLFNNDNEILKTHRAFDFGAAAIFESFANSFNSLAFKGEYSRLLIDLNRYLSSPTLFTEFTKNFNSTEKQNIIEKYYNPYRNNARTLIVNSANINKIIHISIHSFTPIFPKLQGRCSNPLRGAVRKADIGLLYYPKSKFEHSVTHKWKDEIKKINKGIRVMFNNPYQGWQDGFTTSLRNELGTDNYCGIELEVNQNLLFDKNQHTEIISLLTKSFQNIDFTKVTKWQSDE